MSSSSSVMLCRGLPIALSGRGKNSATKMHKKHKRTICALYLSLFMANLCVRYWEEIMKKALWTAVALFLVVYGSAGLVNSQTSNKPGTSDVKIRQRMSTSGGAGTETVLYIKGPRMRNEI